MKTVTKTAVAFLLVYLAVGFIVTGCGDQHIPVANWNQGSTDLSEIKGLEGCQMYKIRPGLADTGPTVLWLVRCPNTSSVEYGCGKSCQLNATTVNTGDADKQAIRQEIDELQKRLEALKQKVQ